MYLDVAHLVDLVHMIERDDGHSRGFKTYSLAGFGIDRLCFYQDFSFHWCSPSLFLICLFLSPSSYRLFLFSFFLSASGPAHWPRLERILRAVLVAIVWYFILSDDYGVAFIDIAARDLSDAAIGDPNPDKSYVEFPIRT